MNFNDANIKAIILPPSREEVLLKQAIKTVLAKRIDTSVKRTHDQWANILFDDRQTNAITRQNNMSDIKNAFPIYFTEGKQYTFLMDKLRDYYPTWFTANDPVENNLDEQMQRALRNEYCESRDPRNVENYAVDSIQEVSHPETNRYIYLISVVVREGSDPRFREGVDVRLRIGSDYYTCTVIEYDFETGDLYVSSAKRLFWNHRDDMRITLDVSFLITSLKERINDLWRNIRPDMPIYKFITGNTRQLKHIDHEPIPEMYWHILDPTQRKAFRAALDNDITFIWGPPGTGKSFTLASIIRALYYLEDERTAVCCVSNVAVDQLVNKVIDIFKTENAKIEPGNLYRAGRTIDDRILQTDFLFPADDYSSFLRQTIAEKKELLKSLKEEDKAKSVEAIELKDELNRLRERLKNHTEQLVKSSRVVFSTNANFVNDKTLNACSFDNLIVDEASMLAFPGLLGLAGRIYKRIILVGDFQQLSPISLVPDRYLRTNIFDHCGITLNDTSHPGLKQLLIQRRSHTSLVDLVNDLFYNGKLHRPNQVVHWIVDEGACPGKIACFVDVPEGRVRFTKGGTRQNVGFAERVLQLLDDYLSVEGDFSIGIITPYKGQQTMLRALIAQKKYPEDFNAKIRVGTVHTFQGSEDDVIIFDMVDCTYNINNKEANIGRIYAGTEGEQLINVAISRARHKLIIVGDRAFAQKIPGNKVSSKFRKMMNILLSLAK